MDCNCFFCLGNRFSLNESVGLQGKKSIIYEDDNIFIIPDIAPLVVGHFLIVSKEHINSFAGANDATYKSLEMAKDYLINSLFGGSKFVFFEHGAVIENSAGSSIDHAHVHGLPMTENNCIEKYINESGFVTSPRVPSNRDTLLSYYNSRQPYIYYELDDGQSWIYPVQFLPHQFFRMMIAYFYSTAYNWKMQYGTPESKGVFNETLIYAKEKIHTETEV